MNTTAQSSGDPADLERRARETREKAGRTVGALEERFSVKRKVNATSATNGATSHRASQWASPEITTLIQLDHAHVLAAFRRYRSQLPGARKRAVVANACLGLEIHARLEEEIFYPALFTEGGDAAELERSLAEHDQMRLLIERLRQMSPEDSNYDGVFRELIRTALHHIADEETTLLPWAEARLAGQLRELGWKMTLRRFELLKPHMTEAASTTAMTFPVLTVAALAAVLTATWLLVKGLGVPAERA